MSGVTWLFATWLLLGIAATGGADLAPISRLAKAVPADGDQAASSVAEADQVLGLSFFAAGSAITSLAPAQTTVVTESVPEPNKAAATLAPSTSGAGKRGPALLASLPFDVGAIGFTVSFEGARPGYGGLTWTQERRIEIFDNGEFSDRQMTHVLAHEIGHAVDIALNSAVDRQRWREARGIPAAEKWWPGSAQPDFATPAGDFAECFGAWLAPGGETRSAYGGCAGTGPLIAELAGG